MDAIVEKILDVTTEVNFQSPIALANIISDINNHVANVITKKVKSLWFVLIYYILKYDIILYTI